MLAPSAYADIVSPFAPCKGKAENDACVMYGGGPGVCSKGVDRKSGKPSLECQSKGTESPAEGPQSASSPAASGVSTSGASSPAASAPTKSRGCSVALGGHEASGATALWVMLFAQRRRRSRRASR